MARVSLLLLMLLITDRSSSAHRCVSADELSLIQRRLWRRYWDWEKLPSFPTKLPPPPPPALLPGVENERSCAAAALQMRGDVSARSVAPWMYRLDRDVDRFPLDIAVARCLCEGCIVNGREDLSYNSVSVMVRMTVLRRTVCPTDQNKYLLMKEPIRVPVACTCTVPNTAK